MSRLIDADKLLQELQALDGQDLYLPAHFEGLIEEQPTAYDLEWVVEQLEEVKRTNAVNQCYAQAVGIGVAIEIVKAGIIKCDEAESTEEARK